MNCQQLTISNIFAEALPSIGVVLSSDRTIAFNLETSNGVAHTISLNGDDHIMNFDMEVKASNLITGGFIKKGSYIYSLPNKAGTIALLEDVELRQYTIEIANGKDVFDRKYSLLFSILTSSNFMDVEDHSSNSIDWDDFATKVFTYNKNLVTYYAASGKIGTVQDDMGFIVGVMFTAIKEVRIKFVKFGGASMNEVRLEKSTGATYTLYARRILGTTAS